MESGFDPGALLGHSFSLEGGLRVRLRLARIREGQRRFAGLGVSTEEYFRWKKEEIELEQRRDAARDV